MENRLFSPAVLTLLTTVTCVSPFYCSGIHESLSVQPVHLPLYMAFVHRR